MASQWNRQGPLDVAARLIDAKMITKRESGTLHPRPRSDAYARLRRDLPCQALLGGIGPGRPTYRARRHAIDG